MKANKLILQVIILALGLVQTVELRAQAQSYFGDSKPACRCCPPIDQLGVGTQGGLTETWPSRERSNVLAVERTPHEFTIFVGGGEAGSLRETPMRKASSRNCSILGPPRKPFGNRKGGQR
jgi:hypothetical protein